MNSSSSSICHEDRKNYPIIILEGDTTYKNCKINIQPFAKKPLITHSIEQGLKAKNSGPVYVFSQDHETLAIAREAGAKAINKHINLSRNVINSRIGWKQALEKIFKDTGQAPKAFVILKATCPLRETEDIEQAISIFEEKKADFVFSSCCLGETRLWKKNTARLLAATYTPRRKRQPNNRTLFSFENGSIYVFKSALLQKKKNHLGKKNFTVSMPFWKSLEIDDEESFQLCESIFLQKLLSQIPEGFGHKPKLIVYDFDGVMTNNHALITETGSEAVWVNRSDGWGINELRKAGVHQVILSTENNSVVSARAEKLKIGVVQGSLDKAKSIRKICCAHNVLLQEVLFVGNDVNDLPAMRQVGLTAAPADGHPEVLKICRHITKAKGGEGVIREIADLILHGKNR